jgi:hypothetical protein
MTYEALLYFIPMLVTGTWSLTQRNEQKLSALESRQIRRIFGPKREEVAGGCRRLHNEEINKLFHHILLGSLTKGG